MHQTANDQAAAAGVAAFLVFYFLFIFAIVGFSIFLQWKIATKAGYPGAYALLSLVPIFGFVVIIIFAFTEWPIEKELRELRAWAAANRGQTGAYPRASGPGGAPPPSYP